VAVHLNFGPPSISRTWCAKCTEETLHKYGQCIHHDGFVHPSTLAPRERERHRLTPEVRREIRHKVRDKILTIPQAAREYMLCDQAVRNIVRGGI
jgi:hypothetical protein